jgi:ribosomal protein S18 acetylase RimI-like enzyme
MKVRGRGRLDHAGRVSTAAPSMRVLSANDTEAIADLVTLCEIAETGEADAELVDWIQAGAKRSDFHAFGIEDDAGLAAVAVADCEVGQAAVEVEVRVRPGWDLDLGLPLLQAAREAAAAFDADKPVRLFTNSTAIGYRRWLEAQGAVEIRHFWRMASDFDETPPDVPAIPDGVTLRLARDEESDLRQIFAIVDTSFAEHFGHTEERTYELWIADWRARRGFDPTLWWVAELNDRPIAALLGMTFTDDEAGTTHGHVGTLGTLKEARGKGIGSLLLRTSFAEFHKRGYRKVTLGVDSENTTGAVKLYESVGMHAANDWPLYELPPLSIARN